MFTQRGAKPSFSNFSYGNKNFFAKGGNGPMPPLNTLLNKDSVKIYMHQCSMITSKKVIQVLESILYE